MVLKMMRDSHIQRMMRCDLTYNMSNAVELQRNKEDHGINGRNMYEQVERLFCFLTENSV